MKKIVLSCCFALLTCGLSSQSLTEKDTQFAMEAAQTSLLEIKLAELTMTNAKTDQVKKLGQMMINDHTKAYNELKTLAVSKNISLPADLNPESKTKLATLARKSGMDFDSAYTKMMVKGHTAAVANFKTEAKTGSDTELTTWASLTLPVLEHHLMMAQDADMAINKK